MSEIAASYRGWYLEVNATDATATNDDGERFECYRQPGTENALRTIKAKVNRLEGPERWIEGYQRGIEMTYTHLRMLTREAYALWQYFKGQIEADPKIKRRMRSKKVRRLFKLEHDTHWRYLRRALDLERMSKNR